ncbi:MAG: hypothetical protein HOP16_08105 [Acidobacteria bacterium]|nr:hypothetical protein [Acidobacteriota bacterium]
MLRTWIAGLVLTAGMPGAVYAQAPPQAATNTDELRARQRIFMMEGVLERAVQLGVDNLRRRVRSVMPDDALLQGGVAQVRGFPLDGYGVFFDIEVPTLRRSLAWSMRTMHDTGMALARDLAQIRSLMQSVADPRVQAEFDRALRRIQQQIGPTPAVEPIQGSTPGVATVAAQTVTDQPADPSAAADVDQLLLNDPNEAYTLEVRAALIDAMIENSGQLALADSEWLTVAARDNSASRPFMSGDPDAVTLVLRVNGADLSSFRAGRLTLEQMRARVQVTKF